MRVKKNTKNFMYHTFRSYRTVPYHTIPSIPYRTFPTVPSISYHPYLTYRTARTIPSVPYRAYRTVRTVRSIFTVGTAPPVQKKEKNVAKKIIVTFERYATNKHTKEILILLLYKYSLDKLF